MEHQISWVVLGGLASVIQREEYSVTGILFLGVITLWLFLAHRITLFTVHNVLGGSSWAYAGVFVLVLPIPVVDEIIGGVQVNALCQEGAVLKIDESKVKGRGIRVTSEPLNAPVRGVAVPVLYSKLVMRDAMTGEELGSRGRYVIKGGWLIRTLGISESDSPLLVRSYCAPEQDIEQMATRLMFKIIN